MKYQVLAMTPRNIDKEAKDECTLDINNQKLKPTANLRIFGGNIDDLFRFTEQSDMCKKASRKIKTTQSNLMQDQASTIPNSNSSSPDVLPNSMSFL